MSRFWIGIALLAVFLGLGLWVAEAVDAVHMPIAQALEQAAEDALAGDLEAGIARAEEASREWERHWRATAAVADHAPMDEIDGLFAQAQRYAQAGNGADFAAVCGRISRLIEAIGEAHAPGWWNLL